MKRNTKKVIVEAEVPKSFTAAGVDAVDAAIEAARPYVQQARDAGIQTLEGAEKRLKPLAQDLNKKLEPAADHLRQRAQQAEEYLSPYAQQVREQLEPAKAKAKARTATGAQSLLSQVAPRVENALHSLGSAAGRAADQLHDEYVPAASRFLDEQAGITKPLSRRQRRKANKAARKAAKVQAKAQKAADKQQLKLAKKIAREEKGGPGALPIILIVLGIAAAAAFILKKLNEDNQADAWQNYRPTPPAPKAPAPTQTAEDAAPAQEQDVPEAARADLSEAPVDSEAAPRRAETPLPQEDAAPQADPLPEEVEQSEADMVAEGGPAANTDTVSSDTPTGEADSYGPDSYVGLEPPEAFAIKGNPRSMKYHTPGSESYDRTITDVWFSSEEAAQAAGFTKATR